MTHSWFNWSQWEEPWQTRGKRWDIDSKTDFRSEEMCTPWGTGLLTNLMFYKGCFVLQNILWLLVGRSGIENIICGKSKQNISRADEYTSGLMVGLWGRKFRLDLEKQVTANWVVWVSFQTNARCTFPAFLAALLECVALDFKTESGLTNQVCSSPVEISCPACELSQWI